MCTVCTYREDPVVLLRANLLRASLQYTVDKKFIMAILGEWQVELRR
jgi:hypothetical protein